MVKSDEEAIAKFNEYVNMTSDELEHWLKDPDSESAGWPKNAGEEGGETVGHESGRKIVEILRENPDKDPSKYPPAALPHIHKVVAYCARHLAQEGHLKETKTEDELRESKSTRSLKNWGHDPIKTLKPSSDSAKPTDESKDNGKGKGKGKAMEEETEPAEEESDGARDDGDEDDDGEGEDEAGVGQKRRRPVRRSAAKAAKIDQSTIPPVDDYDSAEDEDYVSDGDESEDGGVEGSEVEDGSEDDDDDEDEEDHSGGEDEGADAGEGEAPPAKKAK